MSAFSVQTLTSGRPPWRSVSARRRVVAGPSVGSWTTSQWPLRAIVLSLFDQAQGRGEPLAVDDGPLLHAVLSRKGRRQHVVFAMPEGQRAVLLRLDAHPLAARRPRDVGRVQDICLFNRIYSGGEALREE